MQLSLYVYIFYLNENLLHSFTLSIENGESFIIFSEWGVLENTQVCSWYFGSLS